MRRVKPGEAFGAGAVGVQLRAEVAFDLGRHPHVAENHTQQVGIEFARADDANGEDAEAFLKRFGDAVDALRAGRGAADVDVVRRVDHEADQRSAVEHRARQETVGEVARTKS